MKNVGIVVANVEYSLGFEWIAQYLDHDVFKLHFFLLNPAPSALEAALVARGVSCRTIRYRGKRDAPRSGAALLRAMRAARVSIVHAHLVEGGLLGLGAARLLGIARRIYTRHYSDFHWVYAPNGRRYDRLINGVATEIISVSNVVRKILVEREGVPPAKVRVLHHGVDLPLFENVPVERVAALREKYSIGSHTPVVGVISRYVASKGLQYVVPAFRRLLAVRPRAKLVLANARGEYAFEVRRLLAELPSDSYVEIGFEIDAPSLYRLFDLFIHVPIDPECEAFGQVYVEALAAGVPSIFTSSGIAQELVRDRENALVVGFQDSDAIFRSMCRILDDPALRNRLAERGRDSVRERFDVRKIVRDLGAIYSGEAPYR